jgi:hypothetical protein
MRAFLAKHGEIATNFAAIAAVLSGLIWITGGSFPPWYTLAQAQTLQDQLQKQQSNIIDKVQQTADTLMRLMDKLNRDECIDANRRLNNARNRVRANPGNQIERGIYEAVLREVLGIPGCSIMPE